MPIQCIQIPAGTVLAGYLIESELGRGNNGVVYLARQQSLDREVAFKVLLPELAAEPGYVESFLREARLAARLDHPYIVQAYDAGPTPEGYYYFAMELVIGPSLEDVRRETPEKLTFDLIFRLSIELAEALEYAWSVHRMTHGDIKPGNLLISRETGGLKLADLGLARVSGSKSGDDIMATPLYAAPEVIRGEKTEYGVKSDLYSFGVMLYELLCGSPPFVGSPQKVLEHHLYIKPRPLLERNPDLDPVLAAFVERLMDKDPAGRPESWREVRDFLASMVSAQQGGPARAIQAIITSEHKRQSGRKLLVLCVVLLILGVLGAVGFLVFRLQQLTPAPIEPPPPEPERREVAARPEPEEAPGLSVRFSSAPATAPPERTERRALPPDSPAAAAIAVPPAKPPAPVPPAPAPPAVEPPKAETTPRTRAPERRLEPPGRRRGIRVFDPPVDEAVLREETGRTGRLFQAFGNRLAEPWKKEAESVLEESCRLLMQLHTRGLAVKRIDRIDLMPGGHGGSNWVSNGPVSGTLRIAPDVPPIRIAGELGKGLFEANRRKYDLPAGLKKDFAEAFQYFVEQRLAGKADPDPKNRVLVQCNHSLATFALLFHDKRMLDQLRQRR